MFRYNELSDLKDGSLVVPLSLNDDGSILCLNENNENEEHVFDDFDFAKKVEDRVKEEISENNNETVGEIIDTMENDRDDSIYDGTIDDTEIIVPEESEDTEENSDEGFLNDEEIIKRVELFDLDKEKKYNMWRDVVCL